MLSDKVWKGQEGPSCFSRGLQPQRDIRSFAGTDGTGAK